MVGYGFSFVDPKSMSVMRIHFQSFPIHPNIHSLHSQQVKPFTDVQKPKIVGRKELCFQRANITQKFMWVVKFDGESIDVILGNNLS